MSAEFGSEVELSITVPESELRSARKQIQDGLGSVAVGLETGGGAAARATGGGGAGGRAGRMQRRTFRWARQRTEDMNTAVALLDDISESLAGGNAVTGDGGGGGGGGIISTVTGGLGGRLGGTAVSSGIGSFVGGASASALISKVPLPKVLSGVSLSGLVSKVSLRALLTKAPAFATLVKASDLAGDLVTGKLTTEDIIKAPVEVGSMVTFGALDNKAVESAIGTVTLSIGTYQIGSIITGTLSGTALGNLFGSIGIKSILTGLSGPAALSGLLLAGGTLSLTDLIDQDISDWNFPAKFGQAVGREVRANFPSAADLIEDVFTSEQNPFFAAGQETAKFLEDAQDTPVQTPTQETVAPGARRQQELLSSNGGNVVNVNARFEDRTINIDGVEVNRRDLKQELRDAGLDPDEVQRRLDQIERGSSGGR